MTVDARHMAHALALGRRGLGRTAPNPAVGCVIVKTGRVVGRGWTQPGGRPHAETAALKQAGVHARGADAYVSLEPCSHQGKTPPCAEALIDAGIARVVVAVRDPDPRVDGTGLALLRDAGIEVVEGVGADEALRDNAGFFARVTQDRPFVTLKLASSFDGRIATGTGESQWITGAPARRAVHAMRAAHDAVMVGGGTARKDDPSLTVRGLGIAHQPTRVIVSRRLDVPLTSRIASTARAVPVVLCHGPDVDAPLARTWRDLGASLVVCKARAGQLDPRDVLTQLAAQGINRVFCEGGSAMAASLLDAGLVDELVGFSAGLVIGAEGLPSVGVLGLGRLRDATRFALRDQWPVGGDLVHLWARSD
ncbi:MAG: bifunctional diaminohydroxyphosphoribosylaminopyrimidine deaminase/5-amino-6-(5-phosphoribosylamino)uracil reductase RibD [Pseudomonadota bacterium]